MPSICSSGVNFPERYLSVEIISTVTVLPSATLLALPLRVATTSLPCNRVTLISAPFALFPDELTMRAVAPKSPRPSSLAWNEVSVQPLSLDRPAGVGGGACVVVVVAGALVVLGAWVVVGAGAAACCVVGAGAAEVVVGAAVVAVAAAVVDLPPPLPFTMPMTMSTRRPPTMNGHFFRFFRFFDGCGPCGGPG